MMHVTDNYVTLPLSRHVYASRMSIPKSALFTALSVSPTQPDAIEGMLRVANYINEMQRISEMYSSLFDSMLKDSGLNEVSV